jgi:CelD/BcsL family acetyltransferase involved in cellulose biosynthesis
MRTTIATTKLEFERLAPQWTRLEVRASTHVFQMHGWARAWLDTLGACVQPFCVAVWEGDEVVGLAPLGRFKGQRSWCLRFLGAPLNDRNDFLLDPKCAIPARRALVRAIADRHECWGQFEIFQVDSLATDIDFDCRSMALNTVTHAMLEPEPTVQLSLPESWQEYTQSLPKARLKRFDYITRRMLRQTRVRFEFATAALTSIDLVSHFERLRLECWTKRQRIDQLPREISTDGFSQFLREAIGHLGAKGHIAWATLSAEGDILAAALCLLAGCRILIYMRAWDYRFARFSPGTALDWMLIQDAIGRGFRVFDIGRGNESYKASYGATVSPLSNAVLRTRSRSPNLNS